VRDVQVNDLSIDRGPVTVSQFSQFVDDTGYGTLAARPPDPAQYREADPTLCTRSDDVVDADAGDRIGDSAAAGGQRRRVAGLGGLTESVVTCNVCFRYGSSS
jgi:formylglycine-generating enzyme required for sulfatase activity